MKNLSRSPDRGTFQLERYLERRSAEGRTPDNDDDVRAMAEYYRSWEEETQSKEADPAWKENNLEYDLRTTEWILNKVRDSEAYAQNLYAALCNNDFQKNSVWPLLKGQTWSCSWRYAGGVIADMRQEGDYIDWYCSGIRGDADLDEGKLTPEQLEKLAIFDAFVGEGHVTDEVRQDLERLGWRVVDSE